MNVDFPGFALISGTDENAGKYVDKDGNFFRLQGNRMVAVDNASSIEVSAPAPLGQIVGQPTPEQIEAMRREAAGATLTHDSPDYDAPKREEKPATAEQLQDEANGDSMHAPQGDTSDEYKAAAAVAARADELIASNSPSEIRSMLEAAKAQGVEVEILDGDDADAVRLNAEQLAAITE